MAELDYGEYLRNKLLGSVGQTVVETGLGAAANALGLGGSGLSLSNLGGGALDVGTALLGSLPSLVAGETNPALSWMGGNLSSLGGQYLSQALGIGTGGLLNPAFTVGVNGVVPMVGGDVASQLGSTLGATAGLGMVLPMAAGWAGGMGTAEEAPSWYAPIGNILNMIPGLGGFLSGFFAMGGSGPSWTFPDQYWDAKEASRQRVQTMRDAGMTDQDIQAWAANNGYTVVNAGDPIYSGGKTNWDDMYYGMYGYDGQVTQPIPYISNVYAPKEHEYIMDTQIAAGQNPAIDPTYGMDLYQGGQINTSNETISKMQDLINKYGRSTAEIMIRDNAPYYDEEGTYHSGSYGYGSGDIGWDNYQAYKPYLTDPAETKPRITSIAQADAATQYGPSKWLSLDPMYWGEATNRGISLTDQAALDAYKTGTPVASAGPTPEQEAALRGLKSSQFNLESVTQPNNAISKALREDYTKNKDTEYGMKPIAQDTTLSKSVWDTNSKAAWDEKQRNLAKELI